MLYIYGERDLHTSVYLNINMFSNRVLRVLALFLIWTTMGFYLEIPGPTMIDVKLLFKATYEEVSRSVSGRGAGGFMGALIGGILVDKFEHSLDLFVGVSQALAAMAVFTVPFSPSINTLWFHYFTLGVCSGIINIAGMRSVIKLWGDKSAVTLQLLSVGYGLGSLLVPVFVNPFLAVINYSSNKTGTQDLDSYTVVKETRVPVAFVTIGIVSLALSFVFYYFHCKTLSEPRYKKLHTDETLPAKNKSFKEMINPATYANGHFWYGLYVIVIIVIYYICMTGGEEVFANFVRSFSVDTFKFSKDQASYLNMTFWLSVMIGQLFWSCVSSCMSIKRLFMIEVILHTFSTTILNFYASSSTSMLWLCTITEGFLVAPLCTIAIAYGNTIIEMTGMCLMVTQFAGSFGDLSFIWITGKLYDTYGPKSVLYSVQFAGVALLLCAISLFRIGERFSKQSKVIDIPTCIT